MESENSAALDELETNAVHNQNIGTQKFWL